MWWISPYNTLSRYLFILFVCLNVSAETSFDPIGNGSINQLSHTIDLQTESLGLHKLSGFFQLAAGETAMTIFSLHLTRPCSVEYGPPELKGSKSIVLMKSIRNQRFRELNENYLGAYYRSHWDMVPDICVDSHLIKLNSKDKTVDKFQFNLEFMSGNDIHSVLKEVTQNTIPEVGIEVFSGIYSSVPIKDLQTSVVLPEETKVAARTTQDLGLSVSTFANLKKYSFPEVKDIQPVKSSPSESVLYNLDIDSILSNRNAFLFGLNAPLPILNKVSRNMYIGFWDKSVKVEEFYKLTNNAAGFTGEYDPAWMHKWTTRVIAALRSKSHPSNSPVLLYLDTKLPSDTTNIECFDQIGNISTTAISKNRFGYDLQIEMRHPVLGGWSADWYLSFLTTINSLSPSSTLTTRTLQIPTAPVVRNIFAKDLELNVILPPGASNIEVVIPTNHKPFSSLQITRTKKWLDLLTSRAVVQLKLDGSGSRFAGDKKQSYELGSSDQSFIQISYATSGLLWAYLCHMVYVPIVSILVWFVVRAGMYSARSSYQKNLINNRKNKAD